MARSFFFSAASRQDGTWYVGAMLSASVRCSSRKRFWMSFAADPAEGDRTVEHGDVTLCGAGESGGLSCIAGEGEGGGLGCGDELASCIMILYFFFFFFFFLCNVRKATERFWVGFLKIVKRLFHLYILLKRKV